MSQTKFNVILAISKNNGIGNKGTLPWRIPKDLAFFQNITTNYGNLGTKKNVVIMGRKTWESIPDKVRPLKDRINVVLTRNPESLGQVPNENLHIASSFKDSLDLVSQELGAKAGSVFVMGGTQVYKEALANPNCDKVFLTRIHKDFECDTFMPKDYLKDYRSIRVSETHFEKNIPFDFAQYVREGPTDAKDKTKELQDKYFANLHQEHQYLDIINDIIRTGEQKGDRTNVGVYSKFGGIMRYDLSKSFPLLTTKDVFWRGVVEELLWFINGETNAKKLSDKKVKIWDANGSREFLDNLGFTDREEGDLGPVYGFQWRHFGAQYTTKDADYRGQGVDQLKGLIEQIKKNPESRRLIMSAWNPVDIPKMALPPCHVLTQFYVNNNKLSCLLYQRSCDMGLGVPFNIASYSLLACMIADICGLERGEFVHTMGDMHVYKNHVEMLQKQLKRAPNPFPQLEITRKVQNIEDYTSEDFNLVGYQPLGKIKMKMAV